MANGPLRRQVRVRFVLFRAHHASAIQAGQVAGPLRTRASVIRATATPTAPAGWELLAHMRRVMCTRPDVACTVRYLSLLDQLELTLELLNEWQESEPELPSNGIPFRP